MLYTTNKSDKHKPGENSPTGDPKVPTKPPYQDPTRPPGENPPSPQIDPNTPSQPGETPPNYPNKVYYTHH